MESSKCWAFTAWKQPAIKEDHIAYMCWAKEYTATTGLEHFQGYVELKKEYKLFQVKSLFKDKTIHLETAKKGREANRNYCFKGPNLGRYESGYVDDEIDIEDIFNIDNYKYY